MNLFDKTFFKFLATFSALIIFSLGIIYISIKYKEDKVPNSDNIASTKKINK